MNTPTSINKKRSEFKNSALSNSSSSELNKADCINRTKSNRRRLFKTANNARKAKRLRDEVNDYLQSAACVDLPNDQLIQLVNLRASLAKCTNHSLFREFQTNRSVEYIASQTCKHKLCPVCNAERARIVRSKYYNFFKNGEMHFPIYEKQKMFDDKGRPVRTRSGKQKEERVLIGHETKPTKDYDYFHLTLTVPHTEENGWRGKRFYAKELMKEFNFMRKKKFWKEFVFGGEFGCEVTKGENGLHVHIHALVIAYKTDRNRNRLHRLILENWNMQTADSNSLRVEFSDSDKNGIAKSLGYKNGFTEEMAAEDRFLIESLNAKGSTMISLESLYTLNKKKVSDLDRWIPEKQRWKHYVNSFEPKEFLSGIMETIKYHFEPIGLEKHAVKSVKKSTIQEVLAVEATERVFDYIQGHEIEKMEYEGIYNFDLIKEILPEIYRQPLYRKFGALHGVDCLNINPSVEDELNEVLKEYGREETINPETQEVDDNVKYFVARASAVFCDKDDNFKPILNPSCKTRYLQAETLVKAMKEMIEIEVNEAIVNKKQHEKVKKNGMAGFDQERQNYEELRWARMLPSDDFEIQ